jgi:hypothetical protein
MTDCVIDGKQPWQGSLLLWHCAWTVGPGVGAIADGVQFHVLLCGRVQGLVSRCFGMDIQPPRQGSLRNAALALYLNREV